MKALLLAGLSGFMKGAAMGAGSTSSRGFGDVVAAATREEVLYRAAPMAMAAVGGWSPDAVGKICAVAFAADHIIGDRSAGIRHSLGSGVARFADVFMGGLLYADAYRTYGLPGAIAAHTIHNLAVGFGGGFSRHRKLGHCRPNRRR